MCKSLGVVAAVVLLGTAVFADPVVELKMPADVYRPVEFVVWAKAENPQPGITYESVRFRIIVAHKEPFPDGTKREDVFTVIKVNGSDNTQGINDTFQLINGAFEGYWGPQTGFQMPSNYSATTEFTVRMATSAPLGEYTLTVELLNLRTTPPQILATASASLLLSADKLVVGPGSPWEYQFNRIQDEINAAGPEHTIIVSSGTYSESVIIDKSLILRGGSAPTLKGTGTEI